MKGETTSRGRAVQGERGQVLVLIALALPLFIALIALVSDGSSVFANKRSVQNVADASVLAAVRELNPCFGSGSVAACSGQVQVVASQYSYTNGGPGIPTPAPTPPCPVGGNCLPACNDSSAPDLNSCYKTPFPGSGSYGVEVRIKRVVPYRFGRFVGLSSGTVRAKAAAFLGVLGSAGNVAPIPISVSKFCSGPGHSGFVLGSPPPDSCFGAPDITVSFDTADKKKPMLMDLDVISTTGPVVAQTVNTTDMVNWITFGHPGDLPTNAWYGGNSNAGSHNGIQNAFKTDGSATLIPLYNTLDTVNLPPDWYHVIGFAAFVITGVTWNGNSHQLTGHWVRLIDSGSVSSSGGNDFGVHGIALNE